MGSDDAGQQAQQRAMTAERLAHWQWLIAKHHEPQSISSVVIGVRDLEAFVAEVERLRAREAALTRIVNAIVAIDESRMTLGEYRWLKEQARALLASAGEPHEPSAEQAAQGEA